MAYEWNKILYLPKTIVLSMKKKICVISLNQEDPTSGAELNNLKNIVNRILLHPYKFKLYIPVIINKVSVFEDEQWIMNTLKNEYFVFIVEPAKFETLKRWRQ